MRMRMWTYDLAREQHADLGVLRTLCEMSIRGGYTHLGLYLEHRYAFRCAPFAHGVGCLTAEMARALQDEFRGRLTIVPFLNLLGHFEGFLYTEEGKSFAAERFAGLQADGANPGFKAICEAMVDEALEVFESDLIHLGGDETAQLGKGKHSAPWIEAFQAEHPDRDAKAALYAEHLRPLCQRVAQAGRTPAIWGDMLFEHPEALQDLPKETLLFDWQYFRSPLATSGKLKDAGFRVVACPAVHTYNAPWCHLPQTERNIRDAHAAATALDLEGVCITTWECGLMGSYETLLPLLEAAGGILQGPAAPAADTLGPDAGQGGAEATSAYAAEQEAPGLLSGYLKKGEAHEEWARLMGIEVQKIGRSFAFGGIRSSLKCRLLLYRNPFLLWMHHAEEYLGEVGDAALSLAEQALVFAPDASYRGPAQLLKGAVEFVRQSEKARLAYASGSVGEALTALSPCRQVFEDLERFARSNHVRFGGSLADLERCKAAREHVELVIRRVKQYGDGNLGYLPAWEILTHPKFMPHDQGSWWLINKWANE